VENFIKSLGFNTVSNKRPAWAKGKEIDIQILDTNIAIEYNGEYWHSEESGKNSSYHYSKNILAENAGINLIQIFESEWKNKKDIIKSIIKSKLGVTETVLQGRKTVFRKITSKQARDFLNKNHRQGGGGVTNESYALLSDGEIVAVMSFKSERFTSKNRTELYRYASKLDTTINGGFSKLLKNALKEINGDLHQKQTIYMKKMDLNLSIYPSHANGIIKKIQLRI